MSAERSPICHSFPESLTQGFSSTALSSIPTSVVSGALGKEERGWEGPEDFSRSSRDRKQLCLRKIHLKEKLQKLTREVGVCQGMSNQSHRIVVQLMLIQLQRQLAPHRPAASPPCHRCVCAQTMGPHTLDLPVHTALLSTLPRHHVEGVCEANVQFIPGSWPFVLTFPANPLPGPDLA